MIRPSPIAPEDEAFYTPPSEIHANAREQADANAEPGDHPSVLLETLAAPFRGVESAVRNAYNGVDLLAGDTLPDYNGDKKTNFLGNSETVPGIMLENVSQFLTAFIPVVGVAGRAAGAIGLAGKAATIAGGAAAGAFADFVAFDGHEDRLSNLVQKYPALRNPITEFLASDPNDSAATGRFKNALEGLALGALTEPAIKALRAMTAVRKAKAGALPADAAKALVGEAETAAKDGVKAFHLERSEASLSRTLSEKPELSQVADRLAKISEEEIAGGGLFQDPKKDLGRFIDAPEELVGLLKATSRKQMAEEATQGAAKESIELRNKRIAPLVGDLLDMNPEEVADVALSNSKDLTEATYLMSATHKALLYYGKRALHFAEFAGKNAVAPGHTSVEQTALEAVRSQQALASLVLSSRKNATSVGRALNAIKYVRYAEVESLDLARQAIDSLGGSGFVNAELKKLTLAASANPEDAAKAAIDRARLGVSMGSRLLRVHNEFWLNSILSGTKTTAINTLGNSMTTVWQPLEAAVGAALNKDGAGVAASLRSYVYMKESMSDAFRFFVKALRENENSLIPASRIQDVGSRGAIDASRLLQGGLPSQGFRAEASALVSGEGNGLSHFVNFMGETVRLPSRLLMATDELFKQLNYRSAAKAELYYRGRTKGLAGEQLVQFIDENFRRVITEGGSMLSEAAVTREAVQQAEAKGLQGKAYSDFVRDFVKKNYDDNASALAENFDVTRYAKDVAEEATFTRELGETGQDIQRFVARHPLAQLVMPFVRTPTNIVKYFGQRGLGALTYMPGIRNLQARNIADLTSSNALVRARAQGRIATGSAMVSMAGMAALEGKITGRGPVDEQEKKLLMETGWQPYSLVFHSAEGPIYVSYQRLDPLATFLGLVADWSEQAKHQDPFKADALEATLQAAAVAVSANITNKTYLASLAQVVDVISQPDRSFNKWARTRVASYVPSILAQFNSSLDDGQTMKEVRGFFDAAANRIPGAQGLLEAKRNVLGEPVDAVLAQTPLSWANPFTVSRASGDRVFEELAKFNHGIEPPSPVVFGNVNLLDHKDEAGRTAYDRWLAAVGEVQVQGKTLREALGQLIKSPAYQKLPLTAPQDGIDSPRLAEVKRILRAYRQAALYKVQKDIPSVREAVGFSMEAKAAIRRGDRAKALASVQAVIEAAQ